MAETTITELERYRECLNDAQRMFFSNEDSFRPYEDLWSLGLDNLTGNFDTYQLEWLVNGGLTREAREECLTLIQGLNYVGNVLERYYAKGQADALAFILAMVSYARSALRVYYTEL